MKQDVASRREFVKGGLAAAAAIGLAGCDGASVPGQMIAPVAAVAPPALTTLPASQWDGMVGESFVLTSAAGKVLAKLAAVERVPVDPNRPADLARAVPFLAFFETELRTAPEGGKTYQLSHSKTGQFDLFIGDIAAQESKGVFVAVLN